MSNIYISIILALNIIALLLIKASWSLVIMLVFKEITFDKGDLIMDRSFSTQKEAKKYLDNLINNIDFKTFEKIKYDIIENKAKDEVDLTLIAKETVNLKKKEYML